MNCPKCKKEIDGDSNFCEFCGNKIEASQNSKAELLLENKKSLCGMENLNKKMWYRTLKVLYFLGILSGIFIPTLVWVFSGCYEDDFSFAIFVIIITLIIVEIIKRSFYYIYLGKLFPKKQ